MPMSGSASRPWLTANHLRRATYRVLRVNYVASVPRWLRPFRRPVLE
jgi:hypothetical protein